MNRLIHLLEQKNMVSIENLKKLYHTLTLRTHPDRTKGSGEDFIAIQEEYKDALAYLMKSSPVGNAPIGNETSGKFNHRNETLRLLLIYAVKYRGSAYRTIYGKVLEASKSYKKDVNQLLSLYREIFLDSIPKWKKNRNKFSAHAALLNSIEQLAYYFISANSMTRNLLDSYLEEMRDRSKELGKQEEIVLCRFADWLNQESLGEKVDLFTLR
jgi:hypothetical protein